MGDSTETKITRPNLFPECRACPVALSTINGFLSFVPRPRPVTMETLSVAVTCDTDKRPVRMQTSALYRIQYVQRGPTLDVPAGTIEPLGISCPHFVTDDIVTVETS